MCGKYKELPLVLLDRMGSPPHVREVLGHVVYDEIGTWITPACAGSTLKDPFIYTTFIYNYLKILSLW